MPLVSPFRQSSLRERLQNQAVAGLDGAGEGLLVHVGDHQHLAGCRIDGDRDDQAVGVELRHERRCRSRRVVIAAGGEAGRGHGRSFGRESRQFVDLPILAARQPRPGCLSSLPIPAVTPSAESRASGPLCACAHESEEPVLLGRIVAEDRR